MLVLGMARKDGSIDAGQVYDVAEACGLSSEQVRSCIRRLVSRGLFDREGDGREARLTPTRAGLAELESDVWRTRLGYAHDAAGRGWDRNWRFVAFAIPEARRTDRDAFRDALRHLGGAPVQNGLYVSPNKWLDEVRSAADRHGVVEFVTMGTTDDLEVAGETDPRTIVRRLWDLDDLAARYQQFVDRHEQVHAQIEAVRKSGRRITDAEFTSATLQTIIEFRECYSADPMLPPELLPRPWPGRKAREMLSQSRRLSLPLRDGKGPAIFSVFDRILETV